MNPGIPVPICDDSRKLIQSLPDTYSYLVKFKVIVSPTVHLTHMLLFLLPASFQINCHRENKEEFSTSVLLCLCSFPRLLQSGPESAPHIDKQVKMGWSVTIIV